MQEALVVIVIEKARFKMPEKTKKKQKSQGNGKGMLVQRQNQAAFVYGPGCIFLFAVPWILVHLFRLIRIFRFGRTFLVQKHAEYDEQCHLQKFTFPVFKRC